MNFLKRINIIVTDKKSLFIFATTESGKSVFKYVLAALATSLIIASFFNTARIVNELPLIISESFEKLSVTNGVLSAPDSFYVGKWEIKELVQTVLSYTIHEDFIPEKSIVFNQTLDSISDSALITLTPKGVELGDISSFFPASFSWSQLVGEEFGFSDTEVSTLLKKSSISLYFSMFIFSFLITLKNLFYLAFVLVILIFIIGRRIPQLKTPKVMSKFIFLALTPYYILTPVFAVAGTKGEWLADLSLLLSALLISRTVAIVKVENKKENKKDEKKENKKEEKKEEESE